MSKAKTVTPQLHGLAIKQERGRVTYDALINAGFKLFEERDLQDISIAELVESAGYSVGAFYARFRSKDQFFDALIARHLAIRSEAQIHLFATLPWETLPDELIGNIVNYYWQRRRFWRAVLVRSVRDPDYWDPIRKHGHALSARLIDRLQNELNYKPSKEEEANMLFAFQMVLGTINSSILNQSGPIMMGQKLFVQELARAFRLICDFDHMVGKRSQPRQKKG